MRDLAALERNEWGIAHLASARPISDDNLFEWHANLTAPAGSAYEGVIVHLSIVFKQDYPLSPPTVRRLGPGTFAHPNLFGGYICLDLLKDDSEIRDKPVTS